VTSGPLHTERQTAINVKAPELSGSAWQSELDYLTDNTPAPITNPAFWRLINFIRRNRGLYNLVKGLRSIKKNGIKEIVRMVKSDFRINQTTLVTETQITKHERTAQENAVFPKQIRISIIAPLNNTPEQYLREMIDSVQAQTYKNWELCLADGSDKNHDYVGQISRSYAQKDNRINTVKLMKTWEYRPVQIKP